MKKPFPAPLRFDSFFVANLGHHEALRIQEYLVCDLLKASNGLPEQMWLSGTLHESRERLEMLREHGRKYLGWKDTL